MKKTALIAALSGFLNLQAVAHCACAADSAQSSSKLGAEETACFRIPDIAPLSLACPPIDESALDDLTVTLYAPGVKRVLGRANKLGFCLDPKAVRGFGQGALVVSSRDQRLTGAEIWLSAEERERLLAMASSRLGPPGVAYCTFPPGPFSLGMVLQDSLAGSEDNHAASFSAPNPEALEDVGAGEQIASGSESPLGSEAIFLRVARRPFMGGYDRPRLTHIIPSRFAVFLFSERDGFLRYFGPPDICPAATSQTDDGQPRNGPSGTQQDDDSEASDPCDFSACDCGGGFSGETWIPVRMLNAAKVRFVVVRWGMAVAVFPGPQGWRPGEVYTVYLLQLAPEAEDGE